MRSLTVHIPKACHERWDDMQPAEKGRFCDSCRKTVIDYTAFSDQELVKRLRKVPEASCGWFRNDQLNRPLATPKPDIAPTWYRWVGMLFMSFFSWQTVQAQQKQTASVLVQEPAERVRFEVDRLPLHNASPADTEWIVSGKVVSMDSVGTVSSVSMAHVLIRGLPGKLHYTQTDNMGTFSLSVPTQTLATRLTLLVITKDGRRGEAAFEVTPTTTSVSLSDIVLSHVSARRDLTGGGICIVQPPSLWQKVKRTLFR
ncbi:hypothetical protein [Spirosoma luteum]|uniref:hypothetical protein n=1 Tax=Spirosoma luteum TaxID=431553 RepID=UPI0012F9511B|nr:hypothetical protein [Spirosoma luteum]